MADIIIYGAGGHAKVIIDILEQAGTHNIIGLVDDTGSVSALMGYRVSPNYKEYLELGIMAGLVAIGDNFKRNIIVSKILEECIDFKFISAIHPSVNKSKDVSIGDGTVIMPGCNINVGSLIGRHCILNTGANVDHDCTIENFASIAPGVTLGGNVIIGEYSAVGLGSSVIQKISIGSNSVVGAGSVVVRDIPSQCIAFGNPCKFVRERSIDQSIY